MKKIKIRIYTNLNNNEENAELLAIKNENVIKYIDFSNNKMTIDIENYIIERENNDYVFTIKLKDNIILIFAKKLKKTFCKEIKTLVCSSSKSKFLVRYLLTDENVINEYYVNF